MFLDTVSVRSGRETAADEGWAAYAPTLERLMLAEQSHRTANDMSVLMSMLHLVKSRPQEGGRHLDAAMDRVMALSAAQRLLIPPVDDRRRNVGDLVERVCRQISIARLEPDGIRLQVAVDPCVLGGVTAWTMAAIVAELVGNAARHAFAARPGTIRVEVRKRGGLIFARVSDDGTGAAAHGAGRDAGAGTGSGIVDALARSMDGAFKRVRSPTGTIAEAWLRVDGTDEASDATENLTLDPTVGN